MATYARKLKDASGNYIAPATRASCVYMSDNTTLEERVLNMYPIGSVYQSFEDASPASMFGGEWEKLENTFLYGSGKKSVGATGGEENHILSVNEMPSHNHTFTGLKHQSAHICSTTGTTQYAKNTTLTIRQGAESGTGSPGWRWSTLSWTDGGTIGSAGSGSSHNNMPPYTVINIWKRVA